MSDSPDDRWRDQRLCQLLGTRLPLIQGGMVWMSGAKLAAAATPAASVCSALAACGRTSSPRISRGAAS